MTADELSAALEQRVLTGQGETAPALRQAAAQIARGQPADVPDVLRQFCEKIGRHAYRVTADDIAALKAAGHSEDAIFELTVAAAVAAGRHRLARGLAALEGSRT